MKMWMLFVAVTILCWGAYVPTIHHGQMAFGKNSALRAFMFVGLAYFLLAGGVLIYLYMTRSEPLEFPSKAMGVSTLAGILGAFGALGIVFAIKAGGTPLIVAPLVFAGAPIINTLVSMTWDRPKESPQIMFYVGILLACAGAAMALRYKPA